MRERLVRAVLAVVGLALPYLFAPAAVGLPLRPCRQPAGFLCTTLAVPVSREGLAPGTVDLQIAVLPAPFPTRDAVVALAGGPGQAALPLANLFAEEVAPALLSRDLVVFDQRGTGTSGPLACDALQETITTISELQAALHRCALELGPARGGYTTVESVRDIEAIREALGLEKLVLFGTSYGTKVALRYAELYPQDVEGLLLDSVVPPNGPEPFLIPTFRAITPVLDELCSEGACKGIAPDPVQELATLAARLHSHPIRGFIYNGKGQREQLGVDAANLFDLLLAGDLNPALRALFPGAVTAALHGEPAPLLQLEGIADGLLPTLPPSRHEHVEEAVNPTLYWTTTCEEEPFPWRRTAGQREREAEAAAALAKVPPAAFYPFFPALALTVGPLAGCEGWPQAAPAPPQLAPLPAVPTLILSGGQDLRTPTAQAREVAARIPGAKLLVVPYTGHSVLGSDLSGCAAAAVAAFFSGEPVHSCRRSADPFAPTPVPPPSLAAVRPLPGLRGRVGRTVTAVLDGFVALERIAVAATLEAEAVLPPGASFGGLHGGYAKFAADGLVLDRFAFVPGVTVSGTLPLKDGRLLPKPLRVGGWAAAHGTVTIKNGRVLGRLGKVRFSVPITTAVLARARYQPHGLRLARLWQRPLLAPTAVGRMLAGLLPALMARQPVR